MQHLARRDRERAERVVTQSGHKFVVCVGRRVRRASNGSVAGRKIRHGRAIATAERADAIAVFVDHESTGGNYA